MYKRQGHNINYLAVKALSENKNSWQLVETDEGMEMPKTLEHIEQQKLVNQ